MKPKRLIVFILIGIAVSLLTVLLYSQKIDLFNAIDLKLKDVRFRTRGEVRPDRKVVIVAIDSKSVNKLGRWPWDRKVIARLVKNIKSYGARTIAFDIVFSEPSNPDSDRTLSDAVREGGSVIAGYFFRQEAEKQPVAHSEILQSSKIKIIRMSENVSEVPIMTYPNVELNILPVSMASANSGFFNIVPDKDGIIRTANLLMLFDGDVYPSLSLSALRHYLGGEVMLDIAPYGVDGLFIGNRRIPVDESGRLTLNYYGRQGIFETISAIDIINKRLSPDALKDALVFIGATEVGIYDMRATPLDPVLPGIEIHATVASNILQDNFVIRDGRVMVLEVAFIVLFPVLLSIILSLVRKTVVTLVSFVGILVIYSFTDFLLFVHYYLNTIIIFPIISIILTYISLEAYRNIIEEKQSRFLKKAFTSYVSSDLVKEIINRPDMLKLGGEKREVTVLFSDIRGFTTLSERLTPETLVLLLNQYLGPMTDIVLEHKGTLDKYIGDAIMAIYNAPLDVENHSLFACQSAVEMTSKLKEINNSFRENGIPEIDIGIGINTGNVIVGNMGTSMRFDYTAIGDTVNLASRLEGLNKIYTTSIILSEFTVKHYSELQTLWSRSLSSLREVGQAAGLGGGTSELKFRELDLIKVKGKDKPVTIYELSSDANDSLIKGFEEALTLYKSHQFKKALEIFQGLFAEYKDKPSEVFIERCNEFLKNPPDSSWDGVYVAKVK
ncbi:MAG: adenylate/guanylate cyclase domain-containing protein [Nitrospirae bacterium]|nr:adenylate/guanylate cyclase domain-containing protein [Nitrospirota bacterium]